MVNEWNVRAEILVASHRWPVIMLFILVGSMLGAAISYLLPSPYRAETTLQVAYNADVYARNPDDYKNWQMEQLNIFILSDEVLQESLTRLKENNSAGSALELDDLAASLHVYWRNAGEWRLVAEASTPELAKELLQTWQQVILEQIDAATLHAIAVLELSTRIDNLYNERLDVNLRIIELDQIKSALRSWITSAGDLNPDEPLSANERWFLLSRVSSAVGWHPEGMDLLDEAPPPRAEASEYVPWLEKALVFIDQEQESLEPQNEQLSAEYDRLYARWSEELDSSRGLTAYLIVNPLDEGQNPARAVRSTALMAFVGGLLGLLIWGLIWLARPVRQARASIS